MADKEPSKFVATPSAAKDDTPAPMPTTPMGRRVNYYFAKPKEQTPTRIAAASEEHNQQHKGLVVSTKSAVALINTNKAQVYEYAELETGEQLATKSARAEAQAEPFRAKKLIQTFDKDMLHHSRTQCAEFEKIAGMKAINALPKGIFGKKTKANEVIAEYDLKTPIAGDGDTLWCSEPMAWQCKPPFPKKVAVDNLSIFSEDFLQFTADKPKEQLNENPARNVEFLVLNDCIEGRSYTKALLEISPQIDLAISHKSDEMNETCDFDVNEDNYLINYKNFDMNPIPDIPGSEKLL